MVELKDPKYYLHHDNYLVKFYFGIYYRWVPMKYVWIQDDYLAHDGWLSGLLTDITEEQALKILDSDTGKDDYPLEKSPSPKPREKTREELWREQVADHLDYKEKYKQALIELGLYKEGMFLHVPFRSLPRR
jgi:hypothetical protein